MVTSSRGLPVVVEAGRTSEEIEIRLEAGSTLRGVVLEHGKLVAGARIAAIATGGRRNPRTAVSQRDGSFALGEVPRGEIRFTAAPYDVVAPTSFRVHRDEHDGVVLELESLGAIVGHVVRGQRPVAGAHIQIHGPNERELSAIRADADGRFEARGLQPGPWTLFASSDRHGAFDRAPETVDVARAETEEVIIDLAFAAAIAGVVVDQDGAPVPGVSVEFQHTRIDDGGIGITSVDGTFRAATMTGGGQYQSTVRPYQGSSSSLRPAVGAEFPLITLADGDSEVTGVVLAVQLDRLSIAGTVVDTDGAPVADARVTAEMMQRGEDPRFFRWVHYAAATTDMEGRFSIGDLSAGTYALQARSPAGAEATVAGVRAGRTDVAVILPAPGAIEGTLVGFRETPEVSAMRDSGAPAHGAVAGTTFIVRDLSPGTYLVSARTPTEAASARVAVSAGRTARLTLRSGGSGIVTGRVRDLRSGKPIIANHPPGTTRKVTVARAGKTLTADLVLREPDVR